jgi:hypothetical protein
VIFFPARPAALAEDHPAVLLALCATGIVVWRSPGRGGSSRASTTRSRAGAPGARRHRVVGYDPGRERRAEQRARQLLRSLRQRGGVGDVPRPRFVRVWGRGDGYAYLIYPHKPIVAFVPQTRELLNEYCVEFPGHEPPVRERAVAGLRRRPRQVDGADRRRARAVRRANLHQPGRQVDPKAVRRDLWRLERMGTSTRR